MDKADKPDLLQSTRRPFKNMDLALSREVNRQGQRNRAILKYSLSNLFLTVSQYDVSSVVRVDNY